MRVLVAGAGYVGGELAVRLAQAGHEVLALRRSPRPEEGVQRPRVRWLACDLTDAGALRELPLAGVEALAYLVAADARDEAAYRRAYVDGLAAVLEQLRAQASLRRVLFASSTSLYAQDDGSWLDEASLAEPQHFTGRIVREAERLVQRADCTAVALRLGGIYGPGRASLLERVRAGTAALPGAPHYTNRIQRDDAARACAHLLGLESPAPRYVGVDSEPANQADVLRWLSARLGSAPPRGAYDANGAATGKRCRNDLLRASGFAFEFPSYREGYGALLGS